MKPEFYEDEVVEGFYVPSMLKLAWGAQMDVLNETDIICRRHNIPYFADWGTLLAAIRHSGYIPWDDDLDISMRRKDYERFLRYAEDELPEGFKVMTFKNHPGHHFFVARIVGKPRICFEEDHLRRFHSFPYIAGLDLFVLDNVCRDRRRERLKAKKAEFVITVADNIADGDKKGREAEELLRQCESYSGRRIDRRLRGEDLRVRMYGIAEELFASIPDEDSDALVQMMPYGMYGNEKYIPKEYYRQTVNIPYMDTTISVPLCYDAVMRMKFGNYMIIHKAASGHDYPFFYGQHEQLLASLDFEPPAYKATAGDIVNRPRKALGIKEKSAGYTETITEIAGAMKAGDTEKAAELQQAAIEFGTYIESVYGEGYVTVTVLEELCELAFRTGEGEELSDNIKDCICRLSDSVEDDIRKRRDVVFVPFAAKHWKYMEKLYRHYKDDKKYKVHVVPIPYYYKGWDGAPADEVFDIGAYPGDINAEDYRSINLAEMHPAKIVVQNPFDEWNKVMTIPPEFYSSNIRQYTDELIYIPFFVTADFTKEDGREYVNMDHYVCMPGVINADRIVLPSETLKKTYTEKITEFANTDDDTVIDVLNNRIVVCPENIYFEEDTDEDGAVIEKVNGKKTVLYYTTISFLAENGNKAIEKINRTLDLFSENAGKIRVLWVTQGIREYMGLLDKNVADDFLRAKDRFESLQIGEYREDVKRCDNKKYAAADAYYGDPSSIALQFFYNRKPVMIENADA